METESLELYEGNWLDFRRFVEIKAKDRCVITNKNWRKLREIHLSNYLTGMDNPFFFLFQVKFFHPDKYRQIHCIPKYYGLYREQRNKSFQPGAYDY